jgi:hypothetical protein
MRLDPMFCLSHLELTRCAQGKIGVDSTDKAGVWFSPIGMAVFNRGFLWNDGFD